MNIAQCSFSLRKKNFSAEIVTLYNKSIIKKKNERFLNLQIFFIKITEIIFAHPFINKWLKLPAHKNTLLTAPVTSGPIPSPGINVTVCRPPYKAKFLFDNLRTFPFKVVFAIV